MALSPELREKYESAKLVCLNCRPEPGWATAAFAWYYGPYADGEVVLRDSFNADYPYFLSFLPEWVCSECGSEINVPDHIAEHARYIAYLRSVGSPSVDADYDDE
jgi:hypothetical protein